MASVNATTAPLTIASLIRNGRPAVRETAPERRSGPRRAWGIGAGPGVPDANNRRVSEPRRNASLLGSRGRHVVTLDAWCAAVSPDVPPDAPVRLPCPHSN